MTPLERLRLAAALGHAAPAAELRLRTVDGDLIVVAEHRLADLDPCTLRRIVHAAADPDGVDASVRIVDVAVGGALEDLGGGVHRLVRDGVEQRWIPSLLEPHRIARLVSDIGVDGVPHDAVQACLKPDPVLGVTVLVITVDDERYGHRLDEFAAGAAAACFVEELWQCIEGAAAAWGAAAGRRRCLDTSDVRRPDRGVS